MHSRWQGYAHPRHFEPNSVFVSQIVIGSNKVRLVDLDNPSGGPEEPNQVPSNLSVPNPHGTLAAIMHPHTEKDLTYTLLIELLA